MNNIIKKFKISSIEEIIEEARNGKMYILVDDPDRENEGDLIVPAQMATPDAINFMAKFGRGLICLSMTKQRIEELFKARSYFAPPTEKFDPNDYANKRPTGPEIDQSYLNLNVAIAIDHLTLRAVDLGLGTCWVMQFDNKKVKEILSLDNQYEPFVLLPIGFPAQKPKPRPRLTLEDILIEEIN